MTRAEAIKRLTRLFGKKAYWRVGEAISRADEREAARARITELAVAKAELSKALDARRTETLKADLEYQRIKSAWQHASLCLTEAQSKAHYYRFEAGVSEPLGGMNIIHAKGHGDTWEEVFADIDQKLNSGGK